MHTQGQLGAELHQRRVLVKQKNSLKVPAKADFQEVPHSAGSRGHCTGSVKSHQGPGSPVSCNRAIKDVDPLPLENHEDEHPYWA